MIGENTPKNPEQTPGEFIEAIAGSEAFVDILSSANRHVGGSEVDVEALDTSGKLKLARYISDKVGYDNFKPDFLNVDDAQLPDDFKRTIRDSAAKLEADRPRNKLEQGQSYDSIAVIGGCPLPELSKRVEYALDALNDSQSAAEYFDIIVDPNRKVSKEELSQLNQKYVDVEAIISMRSKYDEDRAERPLTEKEAAHFTIWSLYADNPRPESTENYLLSYYQDVEGSIIEFEPIEVNGKNVKPRIVAPDGFGVYGSGDDAVNLSNYSDVMGTVRTPKVAVVTSVDRALSLQAGVLWRFPPGANFEVSAVLGAPGDNSTSQILKGVIDGAAELRNSFEDLNGASETSY